MSEPVIRLTDPSDKAAWVRLFAAYREFYQQPADDAVVQRVWSWILDPQHETNCVVAEIDDVVVGIADYRVYARPLAGATGIWLDDLFTDPNFRGHGIGRSLIEYLQSLARQQGHSIVRWTTAEDNATAQRLYDTLATRATWVTYDATP